MDLKGALEVIGQLWDLLDECQTSYEKTKDQLSDLEEKWKEEKGNRRQVEKVSLCIHHVLFTGFVYIYYNVCVFSDLFECLFYGFYANVLFTCFVYVFILNVHVIANLLIC